MDPIDKIETMIHQINQLYQSFSSDYYEHTQWPPINLKKLTISKALADPTFLLRVRDYSDAVEGFAKGHDFRFGNHETVMRWRNKLRKTIAQKLRAKSKAESSDGAYYVQKVLNDLVGFRIILPTVNKEQQRLFQMLDHAKEAGLISRWYVRDNHKYHAVHCYFRVPGNNQCFQWELQIWDSADEKQNLADHSYHERQRNQQLK